MMQDEQSEAAVHDSAASQPPGIKNIPAFNPEEQFFVFCHVPKSGGTTLHRHLENLMPRKYVHVRPGIDWESTMGDMVGAGGHQMNNQSPIFRGREKKRPLRMIVLRDPLQRFLSFYRHIQDHPKHYLSSRPGVMDQSPSEFAAYCRDEGIFEFDNLQSKYVTGPQRDHTDLDLVLQVFRNEFEIFAPLESFDALVGQLNRIFGKNAPYPKSQNVSRVRNIMPNEIEATAEIVYKANYNDLQLYLDCTRRFLKEMQ